MATKVSAAQDPQRANALARDIESMVVQEPETAEPRGLMDLPDDHVALPGGYLTLDGELIAEARVRELNGEDEEALARLTTPGKVLVTILERAVVDVGGTRPDRKVLDAMLSGDRDMLLLAIRRVTFGDEITYTGPCDMCGESSEFVIDLGRDVPVRRLEDQSDRTFSISCRAGDVVVSLPTGYTQRELMQASDKTMAEINTMLLAGCVASINGMPSMGTSTVKRMGISDRERITREIGDRVPGPRLNEVKKECAKCGGEATVQLSLASLFQL